jgi:hypothetical protein
MKIASLVIDHANDLPHLGLGTGHPHQELLSNSGLPRERLPRQDPIDDNQPPAGNVVVLGEDTAIQQLRAHDLEVSGLDDVRVGLLEQRWIRRRGLGAVARVVDVAIERQRTGAGHPGHAGKGAEPAFQVLDVGGAGSVIAVAEVGKLEGEETARIVARIGAVEREHCARHQAGTHQQHERERHFAHHHRMGQTARPGERRLTPTGAQDIADIDQ